VRGRFLALGTLFDLFVICAVFVQRRPMDIWMMLFVPRLLMGVFFTGLVSWVRGIALVEGAATKDIPFTFSLSWVVVMCLWTGICNIMFACQMSLFAKVSDPAIGGTYMTLLNTIANLGTMWPSTVAMRLLEPLSVKVSSRSYVYAR
jgi:PAT family acetyl-CoA transporter-like MFS transporter 1